jgi:hypothetical protein
LTYGFRLIRLKSAPGAWTVIESDGRAIGQIDAIDDARGR